MRITHFILALFFLYPLTAHSAQWVSLDSVLPDESFSDVFAIDNHVWITSGSSTEIYYSSNGALSFTTYTTPYASWHEQRRSLLKNPILSNSSLDVVSHLPLCIIPNCAAGIYIVLTKQHLTQCCPWNLIFNIVDVQFTPQYFFTYTGVSTMYL